MTEFDDIGYVSAIVKGMVDHPDDVNVSRTVDEMGVLLEVHANAEDMGTIIGREGQNAKALRTILRVVGAKHDARLNLRIAEPQGSTRVPHDNRHEETPGTTEPASAPMAASMPAETPTPSMTDDVPTDVLA